MSLKRPQANAFLPSPCSSSRSQASPAFKRRCLNEQPSGIGESSSNEIARTFRPVSDMGPQTPSIHIHVPNFQYIVDDQADRDHTEPVISSASLVEMNQDEETVCTKMVLRAGMIHEDSGATVLSNAPFLRPVLSIKADSEGKEDDKTRKEGYQGEEMTRKTGIGDPKNEMNNKEDEIPAKQSKNRRHSKDETGCQTRQGLSDMD
ncbi:hypothetical protein C8J56DRAFT_883376 [Mycena floridula]|nr:hypothetical protein C8J56DRAFT_883376 [Mycena floridula]